MRNWESSSARAHGSIVCMNSYCNAQKLDIPIQWLKMVAMAMARMRCEQKPPSMPLSQHVAHTFMADFTEKTVCNSDNDRCLEPATTIRLDGGMQDISDVEIFMKVLLWMFLFFSSLHYFTSLDLSPVQMALAWVLTTSWDISSGGGESLCAGSDERLPRAVLIGWGTYGFVPLHTYNSFLIVSFPFHSCTGLCSQGGRHLKRGIM